MACGLACVLVVITGGLVPSLGVRIVTCAKWRRHSYHLGLFQRHKPANDSLFPFLPRVPFYRTGIHSTTNHKLKYIPYPRKLTEDSGSNKRLKMYLLIKNCDFPLQRWKYPLNSNMVAGFFEKWCGGAVWFRALVGDEEKDAAAKIDLDKQRVEAWGRVVGKAASND